MLLPIGSRALYNPLIITQGDALGYGLTVLSGLFQVDSVIYTKRIVRLQVRSTARQRHSNPQTNKGRSDGHASRGMFSNGRRGRELWLWVCSAFLPAVLQFDQFYSTSTNRSA